MTIPLIRNTSGHQIDEAERLHRAAGVTYHKAHHAYIAAVAATVEAAGIVIGDIGSDCDERAAEASASAATWRTSGTTARATGPPWSSSGARTAAGITSGSLTPRPRSATTPETSPATAAHGHAGAGRRGHPGARPGAVPVRRREATSRAGLADAPQIRGGPALPGRRRVGRFAPARAVADRLRRPPEGLPAWLARSQRPPPPPSAITRSPPVDGARSAPDPLADRYVRRNIALLAAIENTPGSAQDRRIRGALARRGLICEQGQDRCFLTSAGFAALAAWDARRPASGDRACRPAAAR